MAMWNIHELEGRYVGQHSSHSPVAAFCEYMSLYERRPLEDELHDSPMDDGSHRITYDSREFVLRILK